MSPEQERILIRMSSNWQLVVFRGRVKPLVMLVAAATECAAC
jgi:hypothetical protein